MNQDPYLLLRVAVLNTARRMLADGLAKGKQGNVSTRLPAGDRIAITPSAIPYDELSPEDIAMVDLGGRQFEGAWRATSELPLHLAIYRTRPDVGAVLHAHAPYCSVLAAINEPIPLLLIEAAAVLGRPVPLAPFAPPGTDTLGTSAAETLEAGFAVLLAQHGLVTVGPDLERSYDAALAAEASARAAVLSRAMGATAQPLEPEVVTAAHGAYLESYRRQPGSDGGPAGG